MTEIKLTVVAMTENETVAETEDLLDWLSGEVPLRGKVRHAEEEAEPGKMSGGEGGLGQLVVEAVLGGTAGAAIDYVGRSVSRWWQQRRDRNTSVTAALGGSGPRLLSGLTPEQAAAVLREALLAEAARLAQERDADGGSGDGGGPGAQGGTGGAGGGR
ncbi:hypothetical protein ACFW91_33895 [Streptomyces asoensis]|uniref:effector-associated constant component EACC1 n=1 Tax=Streptomyces asoensis TaxID=249586 RepID=UPI0036791771